MGVGSVDSFLWEIRIKNGAFFFPRVKKKRLSKTHICNRVHTYWPDLSQLYIYIFFTPFGTKKNPHQARGFLVIPVLSLKEWLVRLWKLLEKKPVNLTHRARGGGANKPPLGYFAFGKAHRRNSLSHTVNTGEIFLI